MLYNLKEDKEQDFTSCLKCKYKINGLCRGIGICCFEYDTLTHTLIDPLTKKPLLKVKVDEIKMKLKEE